MGNGLRFVGPLGYVLGIPKQKDEGSDKALETCKKQNMSFVEEVRRLRQLNPNETGMQPSVLSMLTSRQTSPGSGPIGCLLT
jgi:hypothetical protein